MLFIDVWIFAEYGRLIKRELKNKNCMGKSKTLCPKQIVNISLESIFYEENMIGLLKNHSLKIS